ncbi:hypothetical protein KGM_201747 [Danaus plexippus plexippus]|uniref:Uncharacterized protein n=1 Tax=Danaus plexippus plexippus TaxID=278856 RepID=A0A212FJT6_DANPL|nr:hypothetical protein KGM_201747 [Danaus plexippus plexippus]
MDKSRGGNL